jgi:hypothetical protein
MNDQPDDAIKTRVRELATQFKEKFELALREPSDQLDTEITALKAQIESLGYTVTMLVHVDETGAAKKLQLAIMSNGRVLH